MADADIYRTILPAGTVITATGQSDPIPLVHTTDPSTLDVVVVISAVAGTTPSATFTIERAEASAYPPGSWTAGGSTAARTTAGRTVLNGATTLGADDGTAPTYYRVKWTVTGTSPSFTLALYGE